MREKREKKEKISIATQPNLFLKHVAHCRKEDDRPLLTPWRKQD
jgi:hypothetical protein